VQLGENDIVPVIVRTNTISILKRNTKFTAYSQYINKNVIDIQLAYEKNPKKCKLSVVRKLFKNKSKRESALACVSLFKSVFSELIVRMEKKLEEGSCFPSALYDIPSQSLKFDLLKLLRTQLNMNGADMFHHCLLMLKEFQKYIIEDMGIIHNVSKSQKPLYDLSSFFTEMISNCINVETQGFYELIRDILWFTNWMVDSNYDTKEQLPTTQLELASIYESDIANDRSELKSFDSMLRSLLALKVTTHSLLTNQNQLNDHLRNTCFSKSDLWRQIGLCNVMPFFIIQFYENIVSTRLHSVTEMAKIPQVVLLNFLKIGMFTPDLHPTSLPLLLQLLMKMKEFDILERVISCIKEKNSAMMFLLALCKAEKGLTEQFVKWLTNAVTGIILNEDGQNIIEHHLFGTSEYDPQFLQLARNCQNPGLVFVSENLKL
jgi:hypothetical protein